MFKKIGYGILVVFLLLAIYIIQTGFALIEVSTPEAHLWIPVPVALGHLAGSFVKLPEVNQTEWQEILEHRVEIRQLLRQLKDLPDADFVEVQNGREHVRIYKQKDALRVSVSTLEEKVQVRLPLAMAEQLIAVLNQPHPTVGDVISCLEWQPGGDLVHVENRHERVRIALL